MPVDGRCKPLDSRPRRHEAFGNFASIPTDARFPCASIGGLRCQWREHRTEYVETIIRGKEQRAFPGGTTVVVYLDPQEFRSTWVGNKSIFRTRMAIADGGELVVLAPGVKDFGEDTEIDALIRRYGYVGSERVLALVEAKDDLRANLSAAAHLIHGSSEGRFSVTYCPGHLTREEVEGVGFRHETLNEATKRYDPARLTDGYNTLPDGEEIYFVSNPAVGLWAHTDRFNA